MITRLENARFGIQSRENDFALYLLYVPDDTNVL